MLMVAPCPNSSTGRRNRGEKSSPGVTEARESRVKPGCTRTQGEDAAQHLTQVLCPSGSVPCWDRGYHCGDITHRGWHGVKGQQGGTENQGGLGLFLPSPCSGEDALGVVQRFAHSDAHT